MQKVKQRKNAIVASWSAATETSLREAANCTVMRGQARFAAAHGIEVNGERLGADQIFINVGGRPAIPAIPGIASVAYLTNTTALDLDIAPQRLIVIGGSFIGLEFAQMHRRFGAT